MPECTCPESVATTLAAHLAGNPPECELHSPTPATREALALNSDGLTESLAAKLGGITTTTTEL